jgi:GH15 family glucan-1,4-alpha-glucosidase
MGSGSEGRRTNAGCVAEKGVARIEDMALIGDCHSCALVCNDGTINWLCLPRFDSPACFAALLGTRQNGLWKIAPAGTVSRTTRQYRGDTLVLETLFETADGVVALIDFMTIEPSTVVRIVEGRSGAVPCHLELVLRFDYGISVPWVTKLHGEHGIRAVCGAEQVVVRSEVQLHAKDMTTVADFTVTQGQRVRFSLSYAESHLKPPHAPDPDAALPEAEAFWSAWSDQATYQGRWRPEVRRSLVTLKALTHRPTGGIAAAATTSLPEYLGGVRNWDYRFCWPRDASFTLLALTDTGHNEEARRWGDWLRRAVAGTPAQLQTLYGLGGERWIPEREIHWLAGYEASQPVRIGNAAIEQHQLDVFGEIELAFRREIQMGFVSARAHWNMRKALIEHLISIWREPDEGIWEVRGGPQQFTYSKAMAWAAMDCAIRSAEEHRLPAHLEQWRKVRDEIFDVVCQRGFNASCGAFTQTLDGQNLDASLLLLPLIGFLPPTDPRIKGTVEAIGRELMADGLIKRYNTHETADGLPPGEGTFLACSFWYASNLALLGRQEEAVALFERLLGLCNDVGLLSEEYDPAAGRQVGNFPQAFSHLALISTALVLDGVITTL